jgi:L-threonylcarbamoyladenylate synthase
MTLPATESAIQAAAQFIQAGDLVVMPTETVYGLAADATNQAAVAKIFVAKRRPAENPLIVHVATYDQARSVTGEWPDYARDLIARFWPGPLTLVLPKNERIPTITTGGLDSVAIRMPSHPVALRLIRAAGVPLAAPSANRFTELSPTDVRHLHPEILEAAGCALDGGPCEVGIESTIVDATGSLPVILRLGVISAVDISETGGGLGDRAESRVRAPGQYPRHYAPKAPIRLVDQVTYCGLTFHSSNEPGKITMPRDPLAYASRLYAAFHELDELRPAEIQVEPVPSTAEWDAVRDRIDRAATQ